jgi:hypothetical protein
MSSTLTLVVPRAEKEYVFLQLVVQAAIRAHREDHPERHEVNTKLPTYDRSGGFPVAV